MPISRAEVEKIALLGRLAPVRRGTGADDRAAWRHLWATWICSRRWTPSAVEPMAHALDVANALREDRVRPSLDREAALATAPHRDAECYLVPAVLGEV